MATYIDRHKVKYNKEEFFINLVGLNEEEMIKKVEGTAEVNSISFLYLDTQKVLDILNKYVGMEINSLNNYFKEEADIIDEKIEMFFSQEIPDSEVGATIFVASCFIFSFFLDPYLNNNDCYAIDEELMDTLTDCIRNGIDISLKMINLEDGVIVELLYKNLNIRSSVILH